MTEFKNLKVITTSSDDAFPSSLRLKRSSVKTTITNDGNEGALIEEICPKCGHNEASYHTLQLRSADEGATVFYTCTKCHHKYRENN